MKEKNKLIVIFEEQPVRRSWDNKKEKWYFSVVDIIRILTSQKNYQSSRNYWKVLKSRLKKEGSEVVTRCNQLKLIAEDKKMRETDVADVETILRLVQSELSTRQIAETEQARGLEENKIPAHKGGRIARNARLELEQKTGKRVVSGESFLPSQRKLKKIKIDKNQK